MKLLRRALLGMTGLLVALLAVFYWRYGGHGAAFPSLATSPVLPPDAVEIVAELPEPPGNLAVSATGRVFFTYHAESRPEVKVLELVNGQPVAYPNREFQSPRPGGAPFFDQIFNLRIDRQNRLWTLDHGFHGLRQPRLLAFDLATNQVVHQFDIPSAAAGIGSYLQDMQVDPDGEKIYIADLSAVAQKPAIVVYDIKQQRARRVLEGHASLVAQPYEINAQGRKMYPLFGLFWMHPHVDPIALDRRNEWLYFGPMAGDTLYRARTKDLTDLNLSASALASRVESYARRSQCDGLSIDDADNLYITSIEDGAINILGPDRKQQTWVKHPKMRWPDGLSFGPGGYLYIADSDIPDVMMQSKDHIRRSAPFYIFRVRTGQSAAAGQ